MATASFMTSSNGYRCFGTLIGNGRRDTRDSDRVKMEPFPVAFLAVMSSN